MTNTSTTHPQLESDFGPVIHTYTRAQAIEDGVLIDVSKTAREAGFTLPVAITAAAYADTVEWTKADSERQRVYQDQSGRLWDALYMAVFAIRARSARPNDTTMEYEFYRVPCGGRATKPRRVTLKLVIGPGDDAEPVVTIMMPDED